MTDWHKHGRNSPEENKNKLFETRLVNELLKGHSFILEYNENNSRTTKIVNIVYNKIALEKAVDDKEQLIGLAEKRKTHKNYCSARPLA